MTNQDLIVAAQDALDANWRENPRMMATAAVEAVLRHLRVEYDAGRFADWSTESLAAQCLMQARDNLDPEYCQFMTAIADRLSPRCTPRGVGNDLSGVAL
ncbi:hypothetical protein [Sphingomonas turrisvirgatae]|uniref:Uncharacterized protein n=1 Tax=Sphingomonas turrisvirgatae TaxID=1888892 RepID=A0A1E3LZS2_9SPHN|nr:hypothetical protein [Sphingomonas turrisvirgatae]ODP39234.1 hypothetical protein BFL28_10490 [Sphingomonas turrisvirgatae]